MTHTDGIADGTAVATQDEAALIAEVLRGRGAAFELLIRPHERRLYQTVLRITRDPTEAADAYQEALLSALEKLASFRHEGPFVAWLTRIAANCALMRHRAAARAPIPESQLPRFTRMGMHVRPVENWAESADVPLRRAELRSALAAALADLSAIDRAVVWLKDAEGLSHEAIAAATGLTVAASRTRLHRARLALRARLARHAGGRG